MYSTPMLDCFDARDMCGRLRMSLADITVQVPLSPLSHHLGGQRHLQMLQALLWKCGEGCTGRWHWDHEW